MFSLLRLSKVVVAHAAPAVCIYLRDVSCLFKAVGKCKQPLVVKGPSCFKDNTVGTGGMERSLLVLLAGNNKHRTGDERQGGV